MERSGTATMVGQFVGSGGSARPIAKIEFTDGTFRFAIPPQWESNPRDITFEGRLESDRLMGSMTMGDGQKLTWSGTRAPALRRSGQAGMGPSPITLFNGKSLDGWQPVGRRDNKWSAVGGVLQNANSGANLVTTQKFDDFKLHLEFRVPKDSNSGVYLRGRYELQVDDAAGLDPSSHHLGGLYGFIAPSENVARAAGEWQSMDVTLVGRMLTYDLNGTTVICNREIPGITGGAIDSVEADPDRSCYRAIMVRSTTATSCSRRRRARDRWRGGGPHVTLFLQSRLPIQRDDGRRRLVRNRHREQKPAVGRDVEVRLARQIEERRRLANIGIPAGRRHRDGHESGSGHVKEFVAVTAPHRSVAAALGDLEFHRGRRKTLQVDFAVAGVVARIGYPVTARRQTSEASIPHVERRCSIGERQHPEATGLVVDCVVYSRERPSGDASSGYLYSFSLLGSSAS